MRFARIARYERANGPEERRHVPPADERIERIGTSGRQLDVGAQRVIALKVNRSARAGWRKPVHAKERVRAGQRDLTRERLLQGNDWKGAGKEPRRRDGRHHRDPADEDREPRGAHRRCAAGGGHEVSAARNRDPSRVVGLHCPRASRSAPLPGVPGQRLFDGACAACHHDGDGPRLLGVNLPLALNSNLHSERPDNLIRVVLDGIHEPATRDIGFMPAFGDSLSDRQIAEIAAYMRQRHAPGKAAWANLPETVARLRALSTHR